jgi:hypothetical protein
MLIKVPYRRPPIHVTFRAPSKGSLITHAVKYELSLVRQLPIHMRADREFRRMRRRRA